jgi:outer membrane protein TolC
MSSVSAAYSRTQSGTPRRLAGALACLFFNFALPALAAGPALTLAEAQRLGVARSRQLTALDLAASASHDMAVAAGQLPDPVLKAGIDNLPVTGPDRFSIGNDFMTMRRIGIMQELTRADKRQWRSARLESEAEKSVAEKSVAIANIQRDTAIAWLERYYNEQMALVILQQANEARQEIEAAQGAYRGGRGTQADILAARSALVLVEDRASEIERRIQNAKIMLTRWTGSDTAHALAGTPSINSIRLDPATLETEFGHHPEISVLTRKEAIALADARLAEANKKSDWTVEVALQQRGPAYSNMISVGISLPLQWNQKKRQDRELSSKLATVEQARAELDEMLREHVAQTRAQIVEWENGRERHARYERELLPLANERIEATLAAYRGGKATLAEVLLARRNAIDVQLQALQLQMDTARLWAQLNFLFPDDGSPAHSTMSMNKEIK